jgi:hypothetical protein
LFLLVPELAWAVRFGKVTVSEVSLYESHDATRRGYAGYLFLVRNDDKVAHTIRIKIPARAYSRYQSGIVSNSRSIDLSAGRSAHVWLYQPAIEIIGSNDALVTIDGQPYPNKTVGVDFGLHGSLAGGGYYGHTAYATAPVEMEEPGEGKAIKPDEFEKMMKPDTKAPKTKEEKLAREAATPATIGSMSEYKPGHGSSGDNDTMAVLVSRGIGGNLRDKLKEYFGNCNMVQSAQKTAEWPTSWLAYSKFEGVILTDKEFDTLHPESVSALADYISVGGAVWVRPVDKKKDQAELTAPMKKLQRAAINGMGVFLRGKRGGNFKRQVVANLQCINDCKNASDAAKAVPAIERSAAPVRLFLVMLIFYAILIGPVLQFILKRKRRRIWMLWIIPSTAAVLCIVVFVGSYLSEGFNGFANFRNITVLDQTSGRASTIGYASFYSPLSDGDGLQFSTTTVLQPQWNNMSYGYYHSSDDTQYEVGIDWSQNQHLTTGWLQAKTPIVFRLWKAEASRNRLTIRKDASGKVTVTNALGADAQSLHLCMPDGTMYTAEHLPMGQTTTLSKVGKKHKSPNPTLKNYCLTPSKWLVNNDPNTVQVELKPGMYQVTLDGHPFVNTAITNPAKDQGLTLVFGRFEVEKKK